jgi:hypothetical protein
MTQAKTWVGLDVHVSGTVAAVLDLESGELRRRRLSGRSGEIAVETHVMAQQQLGQPVPRAHQIAAQILTRPHQVTQASSSTLGTATRCSSPATSSRTSRSASR